MPQTATLTLEQILSAITGLGATGVLALVVYWFVNGRIVAKTTVDQMQSEFARRQEILLSGMKDAVKDAVRDGILEARGEWVQSLPCVTTTRNERAKGD